MGTYTIAVLPGDGIGPEVTAAALRVLRAVARHFGHTFTFTERLVGQSALATEGAPVSEETVAVCRASDAVLFGAVTTIAAGPGATSAATPTTASITPPRSAILHLRQSLDLFANVRPVAPMPALFAASPLRPDRLRDVDLLIVRELTGGLYFGEPKTLVAGASPSGRAVAVDTMIYSEDEIERVAHVAFALAAARRRHLTSVDKANVLRCSQLWRATIDRVAAGYPTVAVRHMLVDACAMDLLRQPAAFDVIVTENLMGDILTDEASMLAGSIGLLPSASFGSRRTAHGAFGLYEPIHGSAPDIAGHDKANPLASILSAALLLRHSLSLPHEADAVESAVRQVLASGYRTADIAAPDTSMSQCLGTRAMGEAVAQALSAAVA